MHVERPLPPRLDVPADLRALYRGAGQGLVGALPEAPSMRPRVSFLPGGSAVDVTGVTPLEVTAAVDGTQQTRTLMVLEDRPVGVAEVAAAAHGATTLALKERLFLACSVLDINAVQKVAEPAGVPVVVLDAVSAEMVRIQFAGLVEEVREHLEREVIRNAAASCDGHLFVDGSIVHDQTPGTIGVIKDCASTVFDSDDDALAALPVGWRSRPFWVKPHTTRERPALSCYLRLHSTWVHAQHGLVRIEVTDPDPAFLDAAAAAAFRERQPLDGEDPRADRQLAAVRRVELLLKARQVLPA